MSAPLDFLAIFAKELRQAQIEFAITSGMACVHYGLQQNTKDSDWIIPSPDLSKLRGMLCKLEGILPPWRIAYRQIFGAPLEPEFMSHGWTSHLSIWDSAASVEHKVDIFSKPPRVRPEELAADSEGWASQHVVAQMKKTDRLKDWPIVDSLGQRLLAGNVSTGLLHTTHLPTLRNAWASTLPTTREIMAKRRPLLGRLDADLSEGRLERLLLLERLIWERVNDVRYGSYIHAWKDFYRSWRKTEGWTWPIAGSFEIQHRLIVDAAEKHGLKKNPLPDRHEIIRRAVEKLTEMGFPKEEVAQILPPVEELLP